MVVVVGFTVIQPYLPGQHDPNYYNTYTDIKGKEKTAFQQHIMKKSGYDPNIKEEGDYSHAYVGALIAKKLFSQPPYYQLIDNIIMGHHRGLYDHGRKQKELKKEIQTYVKERTAPYKYPRIVEFRDSLPKTTSGKIQRNKL